MRYWRLCVLVLFAALAGEAPARAQSPEPGASPWAKHEFARARLIAATAAVGTLPELRLGLEFQLNPGWKTYWRSPGEAGLPVQVDWSESENLADAAIAWPTPKRQVLLGIETMGYEGDLVLPVVAKPKVPGEPVKLRAESLAFGGDAVAHAPDGRVLFFAGGAPGDRVTAIIDRL